MSKALVIQTAYLGDVVLTTPLISRLAECYESVDVVCTPSGCAILETHPAVTTAIPFDKRGKHSGFMGILHLAKTLRELDYEAAYIPHTSLRSAILAKTAGIPKRVGFAGAPWRFLYTQTRPRTASHETRRNLALAPQSDDEGALPVSIRITETDRTVASHYLAAAGIGPDTPFLVLAPGAMWATKKWPHFAELAAMLKDQIALVSIGTESDRGIFSPESGVADLAGRLAIRESAAIIERATLALTNDSAPLHLAGAVRTPVLAIFGPTTPNLGFAPLGDGDEVVELTDLECRPCSAHGSKRCPRRHHRCMKDLAPSEVAIRLRTMITKILEN